MQSTNNKKNQPATLRFAYLKDLEFKSEFLSAKEIQTPDFVDKIELEIEGASYVLLEKKTAILNMAVKYNYEKDKNENVVLLFFRCEIAFEVINFDEIFSKDETKGKAYTTHINFAHLLTGIALSTIRGVLIEKTANSSIKSLPLPIINTSSINVSNSFTVIEEISNT